VPISQEKVYLLHSTGQTLSTLLSNIYNYKNLSLLKLKFWKLKFMMLAWPFRSLTEDEVRDPLMAEVIARKMSKVHKLTVPISKENVWLKNVLAK
jgi:hypothetical protein